MKGLLIVVGIVVAWILLQTVVLPQLGFRT
jgi:hypothetical protein